MLRFHFLLVALLPVLGAEAQSPGRCDRQWSSLTGERRISPSVHRTVSIDPQAMRAVLDQAPTGMLQEVAEALSSSTRPGRTGCIVVPFPRGPGAASRSPGAVSIHPHLHRGGCGDPSVHVKFDLTLHGFHAMVLGDAGEDWFIDPLVQGNAVQHQVYFKKDFTKQVPGGFSFCSYEQENDIAAAQKLTRQWMAQRAAERVGTASCGPTGWPWPAPGIRELPRQQHRQQRQSFALAAMATTMNRVNGTAMNATPRSPW